MSETIKQPHMHVLALGNISCRMLHHVIQAPKQDVAYYGLSWNLYTLKALPEQMRMYLPAHHADAQIAKLCSHIRKDDLVIFLLMEEITPSSYPELLKAIKKIQAFTILFTKNSSTLCNNTARMTASVDTCMHFSSPAFLQVPDMRTIDMKMAYLQQAMQEGIAALHDLIYVPVCINVDYADVRTILKHQKAACIGMGHGKGPNKIVRAIQQAIPSQQIRHQKYAIVYLRMDETMSLQEVDSIMRIFHERYGKQMDVILGIALESTFQDELQVTIIAA